MRAGSLFFIPLFLPSSVKENLKDYAAFRFDPSLDYAFGRLILADTSGGDLIEVFRHRGPIPADPKPIVQSGLLFDPIHVSMAFGKKRWRPIVESAAYDPVRESRFDELEFLLGDEDRYVLWKGGTQTPITNVESSRYAPWIVYPATKAEALIRSRFG